MKVLMVLTSHDQLGNTGRKTGFWLEELAAPYYVFKDVGAEITLASPKGGRLPLDPKSNEPNFQTDITRRFEKDTDAEAQLDKTVRLDGVKQEDYDTVFYPGGHGPMWDLAEDKSSIKLLDSFVAAGKVFAVVCHSTGALRHVRAPNGKLFVEGKTVTGFTNGEEEAVGLTNVVPFPVEDELMNLGATFSKVKNWGVHTVADGRLVTGQNPASSGPAARVLIEDAERQEDLMNATSDIPQNRRTVRRPMTRIASLMMTTLAVALAVLGGRAVIAQQPDKYAAQVPNGLSLSEFRGYEDWDVVSVARTDEVLKVIVANPVMIEAYKSGVPGNGKPFPDGSKIAKIQWIPKKSTEAPFDVSVPDRLKDLFLIEKDSKRFADIAGWGYALFDYDSTSDAFKPNGSGVNCGTQCHTIVKAKDYIFHPYQKR